MSQPDDARLERIGQVSLELDIPAQAAAVYLVLAEAKGSFVHFDVLIDAMKPVARKPKSLDRTNLSHALAAIRSAIRGRCAVRTMVGLGVVLLDWDDPRVRDKDRQPQTRNRQ